MTLHEGRECLTCDFCQTVYFPEKNDDGIRVLGEAADLPCPICAIPLEHAILEAHRILYCTRCHPSLIPAPVFVLVLQDLRARQAEFSAAPHRPDPKELERRIHCPQCHRAMDTHYYAGPGNIVIDDCPKCASSTGWMRAN